MAALDPLRRALLARGVSKARARRLVDELSEHVHDAAEELMANGASPSAARQEALLRLGDLDALANELSTTVSTKDQLLTALRYALLPVLAVGALSLSLVIGFVAWGGWYEARFGAIPSGVVVLPLEWLRLAVYVLVPCSITGVACWHARDRDRFGWAFVSTLIAAFAAGALVLTAQLPQAAASMGELRLGLNLPFASRSLALDALRFLLPWVPLAAYALERRKRDDVALP